MKNQNIECVQWLFESIGEDLVAKLKALFSEYTFEGFSIKPAMSNKYNEMGLVLVRGQAIDTNTADSILERDMAMLYDEAGATNENIPVEKLTRKVIHVTLCVEDVANELEEQGFPVTQENLEKVINAANFKGWQESATIHGFGVIDDAIRETLGRK